MRFSALDLLQHNRSQPSTVAVVALSLLLGLLCLSGAGMRGFWLDEYYTLRAVTLPWNEMVSDALSYGLSPMHYALVRPIASISNGDVILRASSALMLIIALLLLHQLLRELNAPLGLSFPILALASVHPYWISVGSEFRYMALVIMASTAAMLLLVRYWRFPTWPRAVTLSGGVVILLWSHGSALFVLAGLGLATVLHWIQQRSRNMSWHLVITQRENWRCLVLQLAPLVAGFVAHLPLAVLTASRLEEGRTALPSLGGALRTHTHLGIGDPRLVPEWVGLPPSAYLSLLVLVMTIGIILGARVLIQKVRNTELACLTLGLLAGIPVALMLFSLFIHNAQGTPRYLAAWSIPALMLLGAAWHYDFRGNRWMRYLWRFILASIIAIQSSVAILDRGDRHLEAIQWLIEHHDGHRPVLVSTDIINLFALQHHGFPSMNLVTGIWGREVDATLLRETLKETFSQSGGYILQYHDTRPLARIRDELVEEGVFQVGRQIRFGGKVLITFIKTPHDDPEWVHQPPDPIRRWGPGRADRIR